ncbi:hypothetical protein NECAME_15555 [Necator americanus]|uniref:Uncharacterized protein n=1 Tax=Necator americanus TaxID=51031 RepID=W2SJ64_NECAM|nr:hypothetical protein NECAME_15555 [Necator americanus]ETN68911.1 hypothetical protein NECAME_15555 [Necator americanus]
MRVAIGGTLSHSAGEKKPPPYEKRFYPPWNRQSFKEGEASATLMAQDQASMMGMATHINQTPIIFVGWA